MKNLSFVFSSVFILVTGAASAVKAASPSYVVETLPYSNESSQVVVKTTATTSAVAVSSSVITRVDTAFNAAATAALGAAYNRTGIEVQNADSSNKFCGYSASGLTTSNSFKITEGNSRFFNVGKGIGVYCLNVAGSSGTVIVGGMAWK